MDSYLFWNIRGIGNDPSISRLIRLIKKHSIRVVALLEPLVDKDVMPQLLLRLGFGGGLSNSSNKIWILWDKYTSVTPVFDSSQLLSVSCKFASFPSEFLFSAVYARCDRLERQILWSDLLNLVGSSLSCSVVGGDFNIVTRHV